MLSRFCMVFALLLAALPAMAEGNKTFTVGVEDYKNFLPYSEYKDGKYNGLGKDILDAFAKQQGYTFIYQVYPLKRRDRLFVDGKLDFSFPDNPNWVADLKKNVNISYAPILEFTDGVLVRNGEQGKGVGRIKVLGIPLGFTPYPYQQLMTTGALRVEESAEYDALYQKLTLGRVDGAYMNTRIATYYWSKIRGYEQAPVVYDPNLPHASGYWYFSSQKHPDVIEEFKKFMTTNKDMIEELRKRYQFQGGRDE
jgi:ABC-type amino acid transport substrate-binding protein